MKPLHFNKNHFKLLSEVLAKVQPASAQYSDEAAWEIASETFDTFTDAITEMLTEHGDRFDADHFRDSIVDNFINPS